MLLNKIFSIFILFFCIKIEILHITNISTFTFIFFLLFHFYFYKYYLLGLLLLQMKVDICLYFFQLQYQGLIHSRSQLLRCLQALHLFSLFLFLFFLFHFLLLLIFYRTLHLMLLSQLPYEIYIPILNLPHNCNEELVLY